jgi:hypothetical protein
MSNILNAYAVNRFREMTEALAPRMENLPADDPRRKKFKFSMKMAAWSCELVGCYAMYLADPNSEWMQTELYNQMTADHFKDFAAWSLDLEAKIAEMAGKPEHPAQSSFSTILAAYMVVLSIYEALN